jgi:two-component system sensor histidine kinase GlrK
MVTVVFRRFQKLSFQEKHPYTSQQITHEKNRCSPLKLTLFSRTVLSYLIFILLISVVSFFSIHQLGEMNKITQSIILFDDALMGYYEKLTNTLFLETRNEKKFIIMQDATFHESYQKAKEDFKTQLIEARALTLSQPVIDTLNKIEQLHERFGEIFAEEVALLKDATPYAKQLYESEKETIANTILDVLKGLQLTSEKEVIQKIMTLSEMGLKASNMAIIMTIVSLLFGLFLSVFATRSITIPLAALKKQTKEIATGNLDGNLEIDSPSEVAELVDSFNFMRQRLKEVDNMKSDFFSLMSHELRTPLTSIKEGTNLLLEGLGGEITRKQKRILSIIAEESNRLIGLVNSLLDLTKMEAGMLDYHFAPTDLAVLIRQCLTEILPLAESKKITLEKIIDDIPVVQLDTERMLQALRNLVGNAVKFTPEGGHIAIASQIVKKGIELSVRDSGPGIAPENIERIFGRFQQVSTDTIANVKGTGLGLAIVKHIIHAHGGKIWVKSKRGEGSTFFVFLPA